MTFYMFHMYSTLHVPSFARTGGGEDAATGDAALWPLLLRLGTLTPTRVSEIYMTFYMFHMYSTLHYLLLLGLVEVRMLQLEMLPSDLSCYALVQWLQHMCLKLTIICVHDIVYVLYVFNTTLPSFARTGGGEDIATGDSALWPLLLRLGTVTPAHVSKINDDMCTWHCICFICI